MLELRDLPLWGQPPPAPRTPTENHPTLLYSWWCTCFAAAIILARLCGRKVRSNVLFREDWIMMSSLIPLFIRMALVHVILLYGTNNTQTVGVRYTALQLEHRSIGARLVLAARIFYAMFIWISKWTVSEFLKRITVRIWRRSYEYTLIGIRVFLLITFVLVVIATLSECRPFHHYWQVVPDPGPHCRQGYAQLITMGTCDIITDILLVAFPIPIVLRSGQTWRRKILLASLFSLSLIMIAVTAARVPEVIKMRGRQQYRTVWASSEILASAAVANAVMIGSFLRDKGTKRNKYRTNSTTDSLDRSSVRRPTVTALRSTGSEEDLFRFLGIRVPEHLTEQREETPRVAPAAEPASRRTRAKDPTSSASSDSSPRKTTAEFTSPPPTQKLTTLFDVGGLLETAPPSHFTTTSSPAHSGNAILAQDFAPPTPDPSSRRGSRAFLQDAGLLLTPTSSKTSSGMERYVGRRQSDSHLYPPSRHARAAPTGVLGPMLERQETLQRLQDVGGLLGPVGEEAPPPGGGHGEDHELRDLGGLLATERAEPMDASAAELGRVLAPARHESMPSMASRADASPPSPRKGVRRGAASPPQQPPAGGSAGWESMNISDAGGLLGKIP